MKTMISNAKFKIKTFNALNNSRMHNEVKDRLMIQHDLNVALEQEKLVEGRRN